jgi:5-methyltetrahydrofolate--homocysteine methyltransferase
MRSSAFGSSSVPPEAGLLERLARGEVVLFDGAIGTQLQLRGLEPGEAPERMNLERPEAVREVARLYVEAGADVVTSNSFGGSPHNLTARGLGDRVEEVNRRAAELAREAATGRALIAGSIGPMGRLLTPLGDVEPEDAEAGFERQARALAEGGADLFVIETMTDLAEATLAIQGARRAAPALPIAATLTFDATPRGFFTMMGISIEMAAAGLEAAGADIVGSNCGQGGAKMVGIARELLARTRLPVLIQPNAGLPERGPGGLVYPEGPEQVAERAAELVALGVRLVGGCCGTTPEHVRAMRDRLSRLRSGA